MSEYKTCNHCGYYPTVGGKKCPKCGKTVSLGAIGMIIMIGLMIFLLFAVGPAILAFYGLKNVQKKWIGYTSVASSVLLPIIFYFILKTPYNSIWPNQEVFTDGNAFLFYSILVGNIVGFTMSIFLIIRYRR